MHVCFVPFDYPDSQVRSGVGIYTYGIAHALTRAGHQVSVIDIKRLGEDAYLSQDGVDIYRVAVGNLHWYVYKVPFIGRIIALSLLEAEYSLAAWNIVRRINKKRKIDILEGTEKGMFFLALLKHPYPLIIKLHGEQYSINRHVPGVCLGLGVRLSRALQVFAIKRAAALISPSAIYANDIREELNLKNKTINVIANCVDRLIEKEAQKSSSADSSNEKIVLFVGRFELRKGIIPFLKCIPAVLESIRDVAFVVAGRYHPSLNKKIIDSLLQQINSEGNTQVLDSVSRENLIALYKKATICVLPSYYETLGITYLEAMAFKKPVVAFNAGGAKEIIDNGVNGILVEPGDIAKLSQAIIVLLKEPSLCKKMGEAGFAILEKNFSLEEMVSKTINIYNKILN